MRIIVIGNGMVGHKFCEKLIARRHQKKLDIIVFGEESRPAYDRVHLSEFFSGKSAEQLSLASTDWYKNNQITLHLGDPIQSIDRHNKTVHSHKGMVEFYDVLVLATGSSAFVPAIDGIDKKGVFIYRTIEDLELISAYARKARKAAVIGGGLLGLEAAKVMLDLGIAETAIIEFAPRLMPRQLDEAGGKLLKAKLETLGLQIHTDKNTSAIVGEECISGLTFTDGSILDTDILVISAGIRPRDELAGPAGLVTGSRGGIVVNEKLQTNDESIFAIGECALHKDSIYGLIAPGYEMAEVVATNLTGGDKDFSGFDMSTKLKLIGVDVASFGDPFVKGEDSRSIVFEDSIKGVYKRINISNDGKYLLGGILLGDAADYNLFLQTCKNKVELSENPAAMLLGNRNAGNQPATGITSIPDSAHICSCESISKGEICKAVEDGAETVEAIKKCTNAGTGCGGCVPMIKDLVMHSLKTQGKYVRNVICEHFNYSRQELYDLIKISRVTTYDEVLERFGRGDGCELCKPPVASILASLWNEMILEKGNATSQDSNDRFLANIQKGGTYSVVPRIPGGEISPDKLIVIGTIAKKYHLYTKITGGQR
ncbi:MAG TPA: nitrite reductase large subunit NirB, partial [Chitinophagaceae bacterium]|nr:nitrite reductase large subunit NirB [Chitinophagaceae bacterium]